MEDVMKPVVSSIVALAIALAPLGAMAAEKSSHKPVAAKVVHHKKKDVRVAHAEKAEKADKAERSEKTEKVVRVHHVKKDGKPIVHHAHNVDVGGAGHKEPKVDHGVSVVPASATSKLVHPKPKLTTVSHVSHAKPAEMPKLPNPNATKASKAGNEKGARKAAEKKAEAQSDDDGRTERDGEMADLVARIRGKHDDKADKRDKADKADKADKVAKGEKKAPCTKTPVEVIRGPEIDTFSLSTCEGGIAPLAVEQLSVAIRPGGAARPVTPLAELAKKKGGELAPGVHRVDERLVARIQAVAEHFGKPNAPVKMSIVSGYRPSSVGSMHATGRAVDFRLEGVKNEDVIAFCKTLTDTGCGFYPNSSFVHVDVREAGAGHVSWIDSSGPGETPHYVSTWPARGGKHAVEPIVAVEPAPGPEVEPPESDEQDKPIEHAR